MCGMSLGLAFNRHPVFQHSLVDVKDAMMSFVKSRRGIAGTMAKFLPKLEEGIASATQPHPQPMTLPHSLVLHADEEVKGIGFCTMFMKYSDVG